MSRLFHAAVFFKAGATAETAGLADAWNEHLSQNHPRLKLGAMLLDESQSVVGVMTIVEAETLDQAHEYLNTSPYQQAGLYEPARITEIRLEVGKMS